MLCLGKRSRKETGQAKAALLDHQHSWLKPPNEMAHAMRSDQQRRSKGGRDDDIKIAMFQHWQQVTRVVASQVDL